MTVGGLVARQRQTKQREVSHGGEPVNTLLITGVETVVGANIAATLSASYRVLGLVNDPSAGPISIDGCEIHPASAATPREFLQINTPSNVIHCGGAAASCWDRGRSNNLDIKQTTEWAVACGDTDVGFTLISSDGVFTGPWMFHEEDCPSTCDSPQAIAIRELEKAALEVNAKSLIVRTNAFGWSPDGRGWLDATLEHLEVQQSWPEEFGGQGTPILASDLAIAVDAAHRKGLTGIYHICGSERVGASQLARRVAVEFGLPVITSPPTVGITDRASDFGCGETSLLCSKFRRATGVALPMLAESLERLRAQRVNGYRDQLQHRPEEARPYAA